MSRAWQPGDVAMGKLDHYSGRFVFRGDFGGWDEIEGVNGGWDGDYIQNLRPLVVIDPEDAEQVERFTKALVEAAHRHGNLTVSGNGIHPDTTTAALREFANPTPPRPDEPGLWGVVEATAHYLPRRRWVHHEEDRWVCDTGEFAYWHELDNPTVVREGISS